MNLIDVTRTYKTDAECLAYLEARRWPQGVRCVTCGGDKISKIARRKESKNKRSQYYQCLEPTCKQQFSATSGTIFHDSHLPLLTWFSAVSLLVDAKKSMSAMQLQRHLGIGSYRTAWYMAHRIRKAMEETNPTPLSGTVEVDETYIGGKYDKRRKRGRNEKQGVMGLIERGGRVRAMKIPTSSKTVLVNAIKEHTAPDAKIYTDEYVAYKSVAKIRKHATVAHGKEEWVRGDVHTNTVESYWSLFNRALVGSFHQVSVKHLDRYLQESEYRFNARKERGLFDRTISRMCNTAKMEYKQLTARVEEAF
ncbi:MAG: IS1595 family transposase [Acidobacteriia bacterium]|nr:IS1595 family transposase [Terriglobia bacterium]